MNEEIKKYLEERLYEWAEWYSHGNWYGVGYSPCTIEYRLMTEGVLIKSTAPKQSECNENAEEIEEWVNEMAQQNDKMALALRYHYFTHGGFRMKAKKVLISHMQFKKYVDMAHQWLAGRLSAVTRK
ncbi:MAG: antiterminator Q family protein [Gammaproteobacteria bacterium]|nr:antiterminator Q family protein [Gammaproteobacteria bacterium]